MACVEKEYEKTGYLWERYDSENGTGKGLNNFGWSSLIALIELEIY